jgi:MFS family permease
MIVLDVTIVGVALPSIRADLGFSEESLAWVVNAYLITFGGFVLLDGKLGDLLGHRNLFLAGVALFTVASAVCGFAGSQEILVAALAILAASRTDSLLADGESQAAALTGGYQVAFLLGAVFAVAAAGLAAFSRRACARRDRRQA